MFKIFKHDIDAISILTFEAFEAYSHFYLLRKYLQVIDYKPIGDEEILELRKKDKRKYDDEIIELVNFMATEHFAAEFFMELSNMSNEPVLKKLLFNLSKEEVVHSQCAFDLLAKRLNSLSQIKAIQVIYSSLQPKANLSYLSASE